MDDLYTELNVYATEALTNHPFNELNSKSQIIALLPHYLGMSLAFPYLQAGSQLPLILSAINNNIDVSEQIEMTSIVGNFLCWDETGGSYVIEKFGKVGLHRILETSKWFHANLLRQDIERLTGKKAIPNFSTPTRDYLLSLLRGLSAADHVTRCAYMMAFEMHANTMIQVLWKGICSNFGNNQNEMIYFVCHVGGDDPAEAYHVDIMAKLLRRIIPTQDNKTFMSIAVAALDENINWCKSIVNLISVDHMAAIHA